MMNGTNRQCSIDVFICHKSDDVKHAKEVYTFLSGTGLQAFLSEISLPKLGAADFQKQIDVALESANHLVVITTSKENVNSGWVESEWRTFIGEKRSGRKTGNIVTVLFGDVAISDLPLSLRYYESICWTEEGKEKLIGYLGKAGDTDASTDTIQDAGCTMGKLHYFVNSLGNMLVEVPVIAQSKSPKGQHSFLFISTTGATNADYVAFVEDGGFPPGGDEDNPQLRTWYGKNCPESLLQHPVINVSQQNAILFCEWLTKKERKAGLISDAEQYALPSFDEWRSVSRDARLSNDVVTDRTWETGGVQPTEAVYFGARGPFGLACIFGNAFEWCRDQKKIDGRPHSLAVSGGWASGRKWLEEGNVGVWRSYGSPMKDGGFRVSLSAKLIGRKEET